MKKRVLFLCTGNSARSQMAEALLRHQAGDKYDVFSAGTRPERVDQRALAALQSFGVNIDNLASKHLDQFQEQAFDFVITLCDKASQECGNFANAGERLSWHFEDPKSRHVPHPFETTLKEINDRLKMFLLIQAKGTARA
jgi:ArsR family transcriptional regulator, arsenate/arsenite/antimonite-responsive transcriptional repressor / arsenate reductase (thioredoxin)